MTATIAMRPTCPAWILDLADQVHRARYQHRGEVAIALARVETTISRVREAAREDRLRRAILELDAIEGELRALREIACTDDDADQVLVNDLRDVIVQHASV